MQWNEAGYTSHDALISAPRLPGKHVGEEGNEGQQEHNNHSDCECDNPSGIVGALVAGESEVSGIPFTAHGAIWKRGGIWSSIHNVLCDHLGDDEKVPKDC